MTNRQRAMLAKLRRLEINVDRALDKLAESIAKNQGLMKEDVKRTLKQMQEDIERRHSQRHLH
jgi:thioredoxin-like negative regulator of GroEL